MPTRRRFVGLAAASAAVALPLKSQTPAARPAMQIGLIVSAGTDPEAAIRKVHSFGIPTCQVGIGAFDPGMPARLRAALDQYKIEATSLVSGGPGPEVYDFYKRPLTIGIVPRDRDARIAQVKKTADFAKQCGVLAVQSHCGFIPENPIRSLLITKPSKLSAPWPLMPPIAPLSRHPRLRSELLGLSGHHGRPPGVARIRQPVPADETRSFCAPKVVHRHLGGRIVLPD